MSIKALSWAWQTSVKGSTKLVLLALADHADDEGNCWPGLAGITKKCGISRRSLIQRIRELINTKLIFKKFQFDDKGRQRSNIYTLNMEAPRVQSMHSGVQDMHREGAESARGRVHSLHPNHHIEPSYESEATSVASCSELKNLAHEPAATPVISLLLNTGKEYPLCQFKLDEFQELYPAVDVMQELKKIKAWCINNPKKRKTKTGVLRFVNAWLAKEQDKPRFNQQTLQQQNNFAGAI